MKNLPPASVPLAIVIFAAAAAVALRAVAGRPEPRGVLGTEPPPATAVPEDSQPQRDGTVGVPQIAGAHDIAAQEMAKPPGSLGRPDALVEQMQHVFHELHAEGRHGLCEVCAHQYRP